MHIFEVHSNESACRKKVRLGLEQVLWMGRGLTQGDPESPIIFNIMVDVAVQVVLGVVCIPQEAHHRLGWAAG